MSDLKEVIKPPATVEEHKIEMRLKEKILLDKNTAGWLKAHTQIDINSAATLRVVSQVFAAIRDALKEKNNNLDKIIKKCNECPCGIHDATKKAAEMIKNKYIGEA